MNKSICIIGDPKLVEEYSALSSTSGFVIVPLNSITAVHSPDLALELSGEPEMKKENLLRLESLLPSGTSIISSSVIVTVAEQATWLKDLSRLIGIGAFPTFLQGSIIEFAAGSSSDAKARSEAQEFATAIGKSAVFVRDSVGLVMPRILCMLVNEACFAVAEGVAAGPDIDTAMKLGTNYPHGPLEWAERIGANNILAVIDSLHRDKNKDCYRPASFLRKAALRGSFAGE